MFEHIRHKYLLCSIILFISVIFSLPIQIFASTGSSGVLSISNVNAGRDVTLISSLVDEINEDLREEFSWDASMTPLLWQADTACYNLSIDMQQYNNLTQAERQKYLKIVLSDIQNSKVSVTNRNKIYNFVYNIDTSVAGYVRQLDDDVKVDYYRAYNKYVRPFSGVLGTILGLLAIGLFTALTFSILLDLMFLTIPLVQTFFVNSKKEQRPKFISIEAWDAYKTAESTIRNSSILGIYFRSKVKQYILISICFLYLVSGQIFGLIGLLVDYFRGFLHV